MLTTLTFEHISNSLKPTHKPKIAKEPAILISMIFICPSLLEKIRPATAHPTQMRDYVNIYKAYNNSTYRTQTSNTYPKSGVAKNYVVNKTKVFHIKFYCLYIPTFE